MANNLAFTTPITVANLQKAKLGLIRVDEDNSIMDIEVNVLGSGTVKQQAAPWVLRLTNGTADALVADPAPAVIAGAMRSVSLGGVGVATAFTTALAAYRNNAGNNRSNLLTALTGISGVVQNSVADAGALAGTTQPILPPGTVS